MEIDTTHRQKESVKLLLALPDTYRSNISSESAQSIQNIKQGLTSCAATGDLYKGCNFYIRNINKHLKLRYHLSEEDAVFLSQKLFQIIILPDLDLSFQAKWSKTLSKLLRKHKDMKLTLPWRPLYKLIKDIHFRSKNQGDYSGWATAKFHLAAMVSLVRTARRFFPKEATAEVIKEFVPLMCVHENTMFKAMAFLNVFLSVHKESTFNFESWLPHFFAVWGWIENNDDWDKLHFSILSRIATSQAEKINWEPFQSILFSRYIASLGLALGNTNLPRPKSRSITSEISIFVPYNSVTHFFAKTIIYIMSPKNSAFQTLKQTMQTLESFYHPSNSGSWTEDLALILINFAFIYNQRVEKEQKQGSKIPADRKLTKEHHEQFVDTMFPAVLQGIYGKSHSMARNSREALKHLIHLQPKKIFPSLMDRVYTAFETVTATHQSESVMEILGTVIDLIIHRSHYPEGVEHLQALLEHTLNAINPNDQSKTQAAFKVYFRLLSTVPLVVSKGSDDMETDQYDDIAKSMTALLADWALAFLDRIFTLLSSKDKGEKSGSGEWWMARLMEQTFTLLFQQMSDELYDSALSKLHRHVTSTTNVNALNEYGFIVSAAGRANPKKALHLFVPSFYNSLVNQKGTFMETSTNELRWKLTILSELIKFSGSSLIPYKDKLVNLAMLGSASDEKAVCRASAKILRNFLMGMADTFPTDYRSLPPSQWNNPKTQFHRTWGQEFSFENCEIQWHTPSKEELQVIYEVSNKVVDWATKKCNEATTNPSAKDDFWKSLVFLKQTLIGAGAVLPPVQGDQNNDDDWKRYKEVYVSNGFDPKDLDHTIRKRIGELAHQLVEYFVTKRPDDITSMKAVTKILVYYFTFHGVDMETIEFGSSYNWMFKEKYKNYLTKSKTQYRNMKVTAAYYHHLKRINEHNMGLSLNALNRQLLDDLWTLSTHSYSQVRTKAQGALIKAFRHVPRAMAEMLPTIMSTLSQKSEKNGLIKGGIYILSSTNVQRKIIRDWRLFSLFLQHICRSFVHTEPSDQSRLYQLFVSFALAYYKRPLGVGQTAVVEDPSISQDAVLAGKNQINKDNEKNVKNYQEAVLSLLNVLKENPSIHWRYLVIVSTCLLFLIRRDHVIHEDITRWFLRCLNNDLAPLRLLATKAVAMVVYNTKPVLNKRTKLVTNERLTIDKLFELQPINSEEEWQKTEFFDKNTLGWNGPVDLREENSGKSIVDNSASRAVLLETFFNPSFLEKYLKLTAVDRHNQVHQPKGSGVSGSIGGFIGAMGGMFGKWGKMAEAYMGRGGAMGAVGDMEEQAAAQILGELMRSRKAWPYTKTPKLSVVFNEFSAHFWKSVFQVCGYKLTETIKPIILQAVKLEEAEGQAVAAEIIAGMIRAGKAWSFGENKTMWQSIIPLLDKALGGSGTETLPEWTTCIRFSSFNMDPRRMQPLIEYLFTNPFSGATSSTIVKKLILIKSLLNEFTWRNGKLDVHLLKMVSEQLSHPFKQVRHSMGECLATIFANLWDTPRSPTNDQPIGYHEAVPNAYLNEFIDFVTKKLESWEQFGNELTTEQKNERSHLRETVLHWLSYSLTFSESFAVLPFLPKLMKFVFTMQRDSDDDIAKQAMQIPALVAQVQMPPSILPGVLQSLVEVSKNGNWHIRRASLPFLQILVFSNKYGLSQPQIKDVFEFIIKHLADPQIEIRELAKISLTSAVISTNADVGVLAGRFIKWAESLPLSKRKQMETSENVLEQRHGAILGLCSLVLSCPYDVPPWMPELLVKLSVYINDPVPIKNTVKDTFAEFWRTHQDTWPFLKSRFNEDQLYTINELVLSPNYYV